MTTIDLDHVHLARGSHGTCENGEVCFWEAHNLAFHDKPTDACPDDVSPLLHRFAMRLNDRLTDTKRQELAPFIAQVRGTRADGLDAERRRIMLAWYTSENLRGFVDNQDLADALEQFGNATTAGEYRVVSKRLYKIRDAAWARRRQSLTELRAKVKAEVLKRQPAAAAVAAADADAVAVAAAVADAVADADAAAVAAAVADAAYGTKCYWAIRDAVYFAVRGKVREAIDAKFPEVRQSAHQSAFTLLDQMIAYEKGTQR